MLRTSRASSRREKKIQSFHKESMGPSSSSTNQFVAFSGTMNKSLFHRDAPHGRSDLVQGGFEFSFKLLYSHFLARKRNTLHRDTGVWKCGQLL